MATYQLVFTHASGGQTANVADFPDDANAIGDTKLVLSEDVVSIAVGRGAPVCETEWLGAWDWNGGAPLWTPDSET
jgi:hypothetical protein